MWIRAKLKPTSDPLAVYDVLCKYRRVNFGEDEQDSLPIIYYTGDREIGKAVRDYLDPLSSEITVMED